ncbi:hypothetical protein G210_2385 [Candida maltosa Xu316]|uniref:PIPK domain-containing protein n=1 Tax=Candida maltosa (strain Xu316) TaxID=1245528 RepID=M3J5H3_CANMX|nr:hypothetical protein G210_2385 [Candida maltosa Xu316]
MKQNDETTTISYCLSTSIKKSIQYVSPIMRPITDSNFTDSITYTFHKPKHKHEFTCVDHCPIIFQKLRHVNNIDATEYMDSITRQSSLSRITSPGKSGSVFYYSYDKKYIIKTLRSIELNKLKGMLRDYYEYITENNNSLLSRFYGLYTLRITSSSSSMNNVITLDMVVMNNVFPQKIELPLRFDLKGSSFNRRTIVIDPNDTTTKLVFKDLDWVDTEQRISFDDDYTSMVFLCQVYQDVKFLESQKVMDYSLLVGICNTDQTPTPKKSKNGILPFGSFRKSNRSMFMNGIRGVEKTYYLGIVDILTPFYLKQRMTYLTLKPWVVEPSATPPEEYSKRFINFVTKNLK